MLIMENMFNSINLLIFLFMIHVLSVLLFVIFSFYTGKYISGKDSSNMLSTKSPAKGVVKPMVSGHTITKPIINLSRVNMENINNISRLSDIQEVPTPNRSQEMNENRSPIIPLPTTPLRYVRIHLSCIIIICI